MEAQDLLPYLKKFIEVTLDDGSHTAGYITNPDAFRNAEQEPTHVELINGLMKSAVPLSRIVFISLPAREDTVELPIITDPDLFANNH
ncbi:MAG: hypothetical protein IKG46_14050 [Solobacterium sp.]|nr:hypothetical protein [Solobacterium sp.]